MTLLCAQNKMIKILGVPLTKTGDPVQLFRTRPDGPGGLRQVLGRPIVGLRIPGA